MKESELVKVTENDKSRRESSFVVNLQEALEDLASGLLHWPQWLTLGNHEVLQRYRRSVLGPLWISVSMGISVAGLGTVYSIVMHQTLANYLPYLAAGLVVWNFISACLLEGCNAFIGNERSIKQIYVPFSVYVYRIVWRSLIALFHNALVFVAIILIYPTGSVWHAFLAFVGLSLLAINLGWLVLLLALVSARFRDVPQIVNSVIGIIFLVTPILWLPSQNAILQNLVRLNPFYYAIELVRGPLLSAPPSLTVWIVALFVAMGGWSLAVVLLAQYRWRIAYWV